MKKKRILVVTAFISIVVFTIKNSFVNTMAKQGEEESQDILYQDVIITALTPTVNKAVADYYKNILSDTPGFDISTIKI